MQKEAKTKAQIELNEKQKMSRSLFPQEYNSIIKRKKKTKASFFFDESLPVESMKAKEKQEYTSNISVSRSLSVSSVSSSYQPRKVGKEKNKTGERKFSLSLSIDSAAFGYLLSSCRSATGRHVRHEVKLILTQPEFRQLVGSVQTQLHHQRHENLLVYGVEVDNSTCARALVPHADADTHPASSETSGRPQDLVSGAQR